MSASASLLSLSKKRIRDGWIDMKEHPHLQSTTSSDSTEQEKLKPETALLFSSVSPIKNRDGTDLRQDGNSSRDICSPRGHSRLDTLKSCPRNAKDEYEDEIGFEIEMEKSTSTARDDADESSTNISSLAFSISKASYSVSSHDAIETDHLWENSQKPKSHPPIPRRKDLVSALSRKRRAPVFIDVDMKDPTNSSGIRDETPKAHNRSNASKPITTPRRQSLIPKFTGSTQIPRSPAVSQVHSVKDQAENPGGSTKDTVDCSTESSHPSLEDSPDKTTFSTSHPSLEDSPDGPSTQRSHPSLEDFPTGKSLVQQSRQSLDDEPDTMNSISPRTHPSLDDRINRSHPDLDRRRPSPVNKIESSSSNSSDDVDSRWDRLREKLLAVDTASPMSADVDDNWDRLRTRMLAAATSSPKSLSDEMKNELIQDCIDTDYTYPSSSPPKKEHSTKIPQLKSPHENNLIPTPVAKNLAVNTYSTPVKRASSSDFPSKIPTSKQKSSPLRPHHSNDSKKAEENDGGSFEFHNKCLQETTIDRVDSGLTGEFDGNDHVEKTNYVSSCSISELEEGITEKGILQDLFSDCESREGDEQPPILKSALSPDSDDDSCDTCTTDNNDKHTNHPITPTANNLRSPPNPTTLAISPASSKVKGKGKTKTQEPKTPRIEVTLVPDSVGETDTQENELSSENLQNRLTSDAGFQPAVTGSPTDALFCDVTESNATGRSTSKPEHDDKSGIIEQVRRQATKEIVIAPINVRQGDQQRAFQGEFYFHDTSESTFPESNAENNTPPTARKLFASTDGIVDAKDRNKDKPACDQMPLAEKGTNVIPGIKITPGTNIVSGVNIPTPVMKRLIITREIEDLDNSDSDRGGKRRALIDFEEEEAAIIDVSSTLTQETFPARQLRASSPSADITNPFLQNMSRTARDDRSKNSDDRSGGIKNNRSFDTKHSASTDGVPSWRLDPEQSLANFTIQILNTGNGEISNYHLHKHMVAIGPRRSEYLDTIFRTSELPSTRLMMEEKPSNLFPTVLDYIYCRDAEINVTTDNALAYRKLATIFKITPLLLKTTSFILRDLQIKTLCAYLEQAILYKDQHILKLVVARCAETIEKFDVADPMWALMDPDLFLRVLSSPIIDREKLSAHLSILVTEYQTLHKYEIDRTKFQMLTSEKLLPIIDRSAALPLLEICDEYGCPDEFQTLQKRCAHVMACYWKITSEGDRKRVFALLRSLPSNFTVDFLEIIEIGKSATLVNALKAAGNIVPPKASDSSVSNFSVESLCDSFVGKDRSVVDGDRSSSLCWRADPQMTYSDWKIKVKHNGTDREDVYNVHKHILSLGTHRCNFFADVFLSEEHTNSRRGMTTIELAPAAAELVPTMLDFIYTPEHRLDVTREKAVALRFLARVFGIWMLNKNLIEFVCRDMTLENVLGYIDQAETFDDEKVMKMAVWVCITRIKEIKVDSPLLESLKPEFFGKIVSSGAIDKSASCHVSILIAKYFTLHDLSEELLGQLLGKSMLTEIDSASALQLLKIIDSLKSKDMEVFKSIRQRCAQVVTENWTELRENKREEMFILFRSLDPDIIVDMFDWVEAFYHEQQHQTMTLQVKLVKRYRKQLADAREVRQDEIRRIQQEKDEKIAELIAANNELEARLQQQDDAASRRAARSCGASYRSPTTPSKRVSGIPPPRKSITPRSVELRRASQVALSPTASPTATGFKQKKAGANTTVEETKEAATPKRPQETPATTTAATTTTTTTSSIFGFSLF